MLSEIIKEVIMPVIGGTIMFFIIITTTFFIIEISDRNNMIKQCEQKTNKQCKIIEEAIPE